ncbi:MAG: hypothetical protein ACYC21_05275 [Eubacteriales bacterium]
MKIIAFKGCPFLLGGWMGDSAGGDLCFLLQDMFAPHVKQKTNHL